MGRRKFVAGRGKACFTGVDLGMLPSRKVRLQKVPGFRQPQAQAFGQKTQGQRLGCLRGVGKTGPGNVLRIGFVQRPQNPGEGLGIGSVQSGDDVQDGADPVGAGVLQGPVSQKGDQGHGFLRTEGIGVIAPIQIGQNIRQIQLEFKCFR